MKGNRTFWDTITLRTVTSLIHLLTLIASIILFVYHNQVIDKACVICFVISVIALTYAVNCDDLDDIIGGMIMFIEIAVAVIILVISLIALLFSIVFEYSFNDCWLLIGRCDYIALGSIAIGRIIGKIIKEIG